METHTDESFSPPFCALSFSLFPSVNNTSASPVCPLCLCTLFPLETPSRRWRIKKGEVKQRGENVKNASGETELKGGRKEENVGEWNFHTNPVTNSV